MLASIGKQFQLGSEPLSLRLLTLKGSRSLSESREHSQNILKFDNDSSNIYANIALMGSRVTV